MASRVAGSRGRYAPSPTGRLHAGNARTALLAWLAARAGGGAFVMRIEDLDQGRVQREGEGALLGDLTWLGLDWDEGPDRGGPFAPYRQTARAALYDAAIERLLDSGSAFLCACSRGEIARAASAPHAEDDEGPRYPGTCRDSAPEQVRARAQALGRAPAVRFRGHATPCAFTDQLFGEVDPFGAAGVDDFVLRRADGVAAYQLAVVVDDAAMEIDEVVRGQDLLRSTPRQLALYRALDLPEPRFAHVPLLLTPTGDRLAKRTRPTSIGDLRARGFEAATLVGKLAASAGLSATAKPITARELLATITAKADLWRRLSRQPATWTE